MNPKWTPKWSETASKNDAELASKNYSKLYQKIIQNGTQNDALGGPKSSPGAPERTPRAPGPPRELPWTPRDLILVAPDLPWTKFSQPRRSPGHHFATILPYSGRSHGIFLSNQTTSYLEKQKRQTTKPLNHSTSNPVFWAGGGPVGIRIFQLPLINNM